MKLGVLTNGDLERMFGLTVRQTERIIKESSPFEIGVVVSLEGALIDMSKPVGYAWAALSGEIGQRTPDPVAVREATGLTFRETLVALGYSTVAPNVVPKAEARFNEILEQFIKSDMFPMQVRPGAAQALERLLKEDKVKLCVTTGLSRGAAIAAMSKTGVSNVLEGRLGISRLMHPDSAQWADRLEGQQYLRACAELRVCPLVCVNIDSSAKKLLQAKRVGLCTVGVREGCAAPVLLRHSDRLVDSMVALAPKLLFDTVRRHVEQSSGQQLQADAVPSRVPPSTTKLLAPAMEDPRARPSKDTFADEFKSDIL